MNSIISYPVDATTTFGLPFVGGVLHKDHVQAWVLKGDLTEEQIDLTDAVWMPAVGTPTSVTLAEPVDSIEDAVTLEFRRVTPRVPLVDFTVRGRFTEHNLDTATRQSTLIAGEMEDTVTGDIVEDAQEMLEQLIAFTISEMQDTFDDEVAAAETAQTAAEAAQGAAETAQTAAEAAQGAAETAQTAAEAAAGTAATDAAAAVAASLTAAVQDIADDAAASASASAGSATAASTQASNAATSATAAASAADSAAASAADAIGRPILISVQATTSGSSKTWAIPADAVRLTVVVDRCSITAPSDLRFRLGSSGVAQTTGYSTSLAFITGGGTAGAGSENTTHFGASLGDPSLSATGQVVFTLSDASTDVWVGSGTIRGSDSALIFLAGYVDLGGNCDILEISASAGSFDGGKIAVYCEL